MNALHACDIILLIGALAFAIIGLRSGAIKQIGLVAAFFLGLLGARIFGPELAAGLDLNRVLAHIIVYVTVYLLVVILFRVLKFTAKMLLMGPLDRFIGMLLSMLQWFIMASIVLNVLYMIEPSWPFFHSKLTAWTLHFGPWLLG